MADDEELDPDLQSEIMGDSSKRPRNRTANAADEETLQGRGQSADEAHDTDAVHVIDSEAKSGDQLLHGKSTGRSSFEEKLQDSEEDAELGSEDSQADSSDDGDDDSSHMLETLAQMQQQQQQQQPEFDASTYSQNV